ncbi:Uncharacterised protein [Mycobacterium tuberculosis]|nr:Uncharacterised protein [Mycobacterium tuberculosis]
MVKNAAAATTAATNTSTANPMDTWVILRRRVELIGLLTVESHSAEPVEFRWIRVYATHQT